MSAVFGFVLLAVIGLVAVYVFLYMAGVMTGAFVSFVIAALDRRRRHIHAREIRAMNSPALHHR